MALEKDLQDLPVRWETEVRATLIHAVLLTKSACREGKRSRALCTCSPFRAGKRRKEIDLPYR